MMAGDAGENLGASVVQHPGSLWETGDADQPDVTVPSNAACYRRPRVNHRSLAFCLLHAPVLAEKLLDVARLHQWHIAFLVGED